MRYWAQRDLVQTLLAQRAHEAPAERPTQRPADHRTEHRDQHGLHVDGAASWERSLATTAAAHINRRDECPLRD